MKDAYSHIVEVSEIISSIKEMKDQTLDHYYEDSDRAKELLVGLSELEDDANKLIKDFESLF
jgi:hypothetical protein